MNKSLEEKYWRKTRRFVRFLQMVPFLRMVAVCNNLAFGKIDEKSDIDLFIVAESGRLFIVRSFVTLILQLLGVRRHGKKVTGRFCLSFFIDDSHLNLTDIAIRNDIYLAFWIKSMKPVIDDGVSLDFLQNNGWAKYYFEKDEFFVDTTNVLGENSLLKGLKKFLSFVFGGQFGDFLERKLKKWQLKRARKKAALADSRADLILEENILKFHLIDRRREYRNLWEKNVEGSKIKQSSFLRILK